MKIEKINNFLDKVIEKGSESSNKYIAPKLFVNNYEIIIEFDFGGWEYDWTISIMYKNTIIDLHGCGYDGTITGNIDLE